ncbi:RHS repeat-associated core domain-containing protein, partial [Acidovorax sp. Leaf191]|uniref:RHS repeat-associated core domain-containing protein n=2 Tax=unclassified Acidovorax TaxID=2684926 RepID=UPI000A9A5AD2
SDPASAAPLIGGLRQRRYTYDSLGQLVGIQTPTHADAYQYDARQRLTGQHSASAQGEQQARWRLDPAGNRLPDPVPGKHPGGNTAAGADWTAQVQQHLHDPRFNLLQPQPSADNPATEHVERWRDNRIGWSQGAGDEGATHYRYDDWGNRIEARHGDGSTTALHYDGLHQLRQVLQTNAQGQVKSKTTYRYDAFGRRVSKVHQQTGQDSQSTHYGWDGDRLVHTQSHGQIHHTVYEPGSFVPLLQVQRSQQGHTNPVKTLLALAGSEDPEQDLQHGDKEMLRQALKEVLQPGFQLSALLPQDMRDQVQESLQFLKKAQTHSEEAHPLAIRHFVTDHLGTPIALVNANGDQAGEVSWAARYGAWGEIEQEYNPHRIHQPIRLQGQQLDAETGLHYNRFRYYDAQVGQYVTQDPIGLSGGANNALYPVNPITYYDSLGLLGECSGGGCASATTSFLGSAASAVKNAFPQSKDEWADYLGKQADYFGAAAVGMTYSGVLAPAAPVAAVIGAAADAGSKMLKPPPNIVHASDTVIDIAGAGAPGGFFKDVALTAIKKTISIGADATASSMPAASPSGSPKSCKKSDYQ